jgi:glutathione peroxidase
MMPIYDFTVMDAEGAEVCLSEYRGKVLLVIHTEFRREFTPQYDGLQTLYEKYRARGFEILDFPCGGFGYPARAITAEIGSFCTTHYGTTFPRFAEIGIFGAKVSPLYEWLKAQKEGVSGSNIKWEFSKFLIDRKGEVVCRFPPLTTRAALEKEIDRII